MSDNVYMEAYYGKLPEFEEIERCFGEIQKTARKEGYNSNPNKYNCLLSSEADRRTSDIWSKELNNSGISLYSFICERGQWILYYRHLTDKLQKQPDFTTIEYIKNENGISELQNLKLHKELGIFHKWIFGIIV